MTGPARPVAAACDLPAARRAGRARPEIAHV